MALLPLTPLSCRNVTKWRVLIGATQLSHLGPEVQVRHIKRLLAHQHYTADSQQNDIALLELDRPVECTDYVQLACVPNASLTVSELKTCYIAGWGSASAKGEFPKRAPSPEGKLGTPEKWVGFLTAETKVRQ